MKSKLTRGLLRIAVLMLTVILWSELDAQIRYDTYLDKGDIHVGSLLSLADPDTSSSGEFHFVRRTQLLSLEYTTDGLTDVQTYTAWSYSMVVKVMNGHDSSQYFLDTLSIQRNDSLPIYRSSQYYDLPWPSLRLRVMEVCGKTGVDSSCVSNPDAYPLIPSDIQLSLAIIKVEITGLPAMAKENSTEFYDSDIEQDCEELYNDRLSVLLEQYEGKELLAMQEAIDGLDDYLDAERIIKEKLLSLSERTLDTLELADSAYIFLCDSILLDSLQWNQVHAIGNTAFQKDFISDYLSWQADYNHDNFRILTQMEMADAEKEAMTNYFFMAMGGRIEKVNQNVLAAYLPHLSDCYADAYSDTAAHWLDYVLRAVEGYYSIRNEVLDSMSISDSLYRDFQFTKSGVYGSVFQEKLNAINALNDDTYALCGYGGENYTSCGEFYSNLVNGINAQISHIKDSIAAQVASAYSISSSMLTDYNATSQSVLYALGNDYILKMDSLDLSWTYCSSDSLQQSVIKGITGQLNTQDIPAYATQFLDAVLTSMENYFLVNGISMDSSSWSSLNASLLGAFSSDGKILQNDKLYAINQTFWMLDSCSYATYNATYPIAQMLISEMLSSIDSNLMAANAFGGSSLYRYQAALAEFNVRFAGGAGFLESRLDSIQDEQRLSCGSSSEPESSVFTCLRSFDQYIAYVNEQKSIMESSLDSLTAAYAGIDRPGGWNASNGDISVMFNDFLLPQYVYRIDSLALESVGICLDSAQKEFMASIMLENNAAYEKEYYALFFRTAYDHLTDWENNEEPHDYISANMEQLEADLMEIYFNFFGLRLDARAGYALRRMGIEEQVAPCVDTIFTESENNPLFPILMEFMQDFNRHIYAGAVGITTDTVAYKQSVLYYTFMQNFINGSYTKYYSYFASERGNCQNNTASLPKEEEGVAFDENSSLVLEAEMAECQNYVEANMEDIINIGFPALGNVPKIVFGENAPALFMDSDLSFQVLGHADSLWVNCDSSGLNLAAVDWVFQSDIGLSVMYSYPTDYMTDMSLLFDGEIPIYDYLDEIEIVDSIYFMRLAQSRADYIINAINSNQGFFSPISSCMASRTDSAAISTYELAYQQYKTNLQDSINSWVWNFVTDSAQLDSAKMKLRWSFAEAKRQLYNLLLEMVSYEQQYEECGNIVSQKVAWIPEQDQGYNEPRKIIVKPVASLPGIYDLLPVRENVMSLTQGTVSVITDEGDCGGTRYIHWDPISGAQEYDLEWVYIDNSIYLGVHKANASINIAYNAFTMAEPVRVTLKENQFPFPEEYPDGKLYFRVRGVGRIIDNTYNDFDQPQFFPWVYNWSGYPVSSYNVNFNGNNPFNSSYENNLNWQWECSYAEEGKFKKVIGYHDGMNRSRQMVTHMSTDNLSVIAETLYDHEGRAAVQVLPYPEACKELSYRNHTREDESGSDFDKEDFELDASAKNMKTSVGASQYYSSNNPFLAIENPLMHTGTIPSAGGYPYAQTSFLPDNTGRPMASGGVGTDHTLAGDHATRYFYANASETELTRLFGKNVGVASHYKKNAVMDANGQLSVAYVDQEGRSVATALAGLSPDNVMALESNVGEYFTQNLMANNIYDVQENSWTVTYNQLNEVPGNEYTFRYDYGADYFNGLVQCHTCEFDLEIYITDVKGLRIELEDMLDNGSVISGPVTTFTKHIQHDNYFYSTPCGQHGSEGTIMFTATLPDIGIYTIHKILKWDKEAMLEALTEELSSSSNTTYQVFLDYYMDQIDYTQCEQMFPGSGFGAIPQDLTDDTYTGSFNSQCESYLTQMKTQIEPWQGAGAPPIPTMGVLTNDNGFWDRVLDLIEEGINAPNNSDYISPTAVLAYEGATPLATRNNIRAQNTTWSDELLDELAKAHPEYCWYKKCISYAQGVPYDAQMASKTDLTDGKPYRNPQLQSEAAITTDRVALFGPDNSQPFISDPVSNEAIKNAVKIMGPDENTNIWKLGSDMGAYVGNADISTEEAKWQTFRGGYLQAKTNAFYTETETCPLQDPNNSHTIVKKPDLPEDGDEMDEANETNLNFFENGGPLCTTVCEENADAWMAQLFTNCGEPQLQTVMGMSVYVLNTYVDQIREKLIEYCMAQCGVENPFGIITDQMYQDALSAQNGPLWEAIQLYEQHFENTENCMDTEEAFESFVYEEEEYEEICHTNTASFQGIHDVMKLMTKLSAAFTSMSNNTLEVSPFMTSGGASVSIYQNLTGATCIPLTVSPCGSPQALAIPNPNPNPCASDCRIEIYNSTARMYLDQITGIALAESPSNPILYQTGYTQVPITYTSGGNTYSGTLKIYTEDCCQETVCIIGPLGWDVVVDTEALEDDCEEELQNNAAQSAQAAYDNWFENTINEAYLSTNCQIRELFSVSYTKREYHYTLYYYDQAGNLVQTVPPKGVHPLDNSSFSSTGVWNNTDNPAHNMESRYKFNGLNVAIESETPDGGLTYYRPDVLGRPVESINAEQQKRAIYLAATSGIPEFHKYVRISSISHYDGLGRIDSVYEQKLVANNNLSNPDYHPQRFDAGVISVSLSQITETKYDDPLSVPLGQGWIAQHTRARVASVRYYETQSPNWQHGTYYSYDIHGNVKSMVTDVPALTEFNQRYRKLDYYYDLVSGKVNEVHYQPTGADRIFYRYSYDADNRLVLAESSRDYVHWERDAKYFYYLHGPLKRVETGQRKVQGSDYFYTVHGWLKGVNAGTLDETHDVGKDGWYTNAGNANAMVARDAYGFSLDYYNGDYTPVVTGMGHLPGLAGSDFAAAVMEQGLYNGNISRMATALLKTDETRMDVLGKAYWYDQLNRIRRDTSFLATDLHTGNSWAGIGGSLAYNGRYAYDANGNILSLQRRDASGVLTDDFVAYHYTDKGTPGIFEHYNYVGPQNRLGYIDDAVGGQGMADQSAGNYGYDEIGNLVRDEAEEIAEIRWTVYGKVRNVIREGTSTKPDLDFRYNASGQRYLKVVKPKNANGTLKGPGSWIFTYYAHDAQGNVLAVYDIKDGDSECGYEMYLGEHVLYGSSRLGVARYDKLKLGKMDHSFPGYGIPNLYLCLLESQGEISTAIAGVLETGGGGQTPGGDLTTIKPYGPVKGPGVSTPITGVNLPWATATTVKPAKEPSVFAPGKKQYEFSNHLGNVLVTISDLPLGVDEGSNGTVDYYMPNVLTVNDYEPFGAPLEGRTEVEASGYRFLFNGQERVDEVYGEGNSYTAEFWQYDTRIGRRWNMDPKPTIGISDYAVFENFPIVFNDPLGDKIRGTRAEKKALRQRGDWEQIRATYKGRNSERDLNLHQIKGDRRVTDDILHANIVAHPLNVQRTDDPGRQDYLYFTPLTKTVKESYTFFGIGGITRKPTERESKNRFISGTITISAISNIDVYGMDRITIYGGTANTAPIYNQKAGPVAQGIVPIVGTVNFDFSSNDKAEKITTVWSNDGSPLSGPHAGVVKIQIVGVKYVDKRFIKIP